MEKNEIIPTKFDYWHWANVIDNNQIKEINSICEKYNETDFYERPADYTTKKVGVKAIRWGYLKPLLFDVMEMLLRANNDVFGYSLFPVLKRNFFNLNTYDASDCGEYDWHLDGSNSHVCDVKLTGILIISDEPYEGGEFNLFCGGFITIPEVREPGTLLLVDHKTLHKVDPVTKGKRKTLSYLFTGPKFI